MPTNEVLNIYKVEGNLGDPINNGDNVYFRSSNLQYMTAIGGGGLVGDGSVMVDRDWVQTWETFTLQFL